MEDKSEKEGMVEVEVEIESDKQNLLSEAQELLVQAKNNLRNSPQAAHAFLTFALYQHKSWKKQQKKAGKTATEKDFFAQTPFTAGFLKDLEQHNWSSLVKAAKIADFYEILLEQAVAVGLGILQGDNPAETERQLAVARENRSQIFLGGVCGNLRDYPEEGKALAAFIYTEHERIQSKLPEKERELISCFCRRIGFSYPTLLHLRKGKGRNHCLSVIKALGIARNLDVSLEQAVNFGKEILGALAEENK